MLVVFIYFMCATDVTRSVFNEFNVKPVKPGVALLYSAQRLDCGLVV